MAERIEISDPQVKMLVDKAIADLEGFYPDKTVESLDALHKGLSKRIGRVWKLAGYTSRDEFLAAYGFVVKHASGGRPTTTDPEALLTELAKRYEGRESPDSLGSLIQDNPDLKGPLKTLSNKAPEFFGRTLAKELASRRLLKSEAKTSSGVSDTELQAMLDALTVKYAHAAPRPSSIEQLKVENPEYTAEIAALVSRSRSLYNTTPKEKLIALGILASKANGNQLKATINELGEKLCDIPNGEKPQTVDELAQRLPDLGAVLASGIKRRLVTKKTLQELGILAPSATAVRTTGIRKIKPDELAGEYGKTGLPTLIKPDDANVGRLPYGVCGIDMESTAELRRTLVMFELPDGADVSAGDVFQLSIETFYNEWGFESHRFHAMTDTMTLTAKYSPHWVFCKDCHDETKSPLSPYVGAKAVKVSRHGDVRVAQLELTWLAALQSDTLTAILRTFDIVRGPDLLGGFGWRFRIWQIENGLHSLGEPNEDRRKQPKTKSAAKKSKAAKSATDDKDNLAKTLAAGSEKDELDEKVAGSSSKKTRAKKSAETADEGKAARKAPAKAGKKASASKAEKTEGPDASKGKPVKSAAADAGKDKPKAAKKKSKEPLDSSAKKVSSTDFGSDVEALEKNDGGAAEAVKQPAESATEPASAKKTLTEALAQVHTSVEQEIAKGAPGTSGVEVMRKTRAAMVSAGGDGSMFDATIRELERKEASGDLPRRPLGEDELAQDKPLGQVLELLRAEGGGLSRGTVVNKLGYDVVKSAVADSAIVESDGKLYLWCQHDTQGQPMRDFKPVIDALKERLGTLRKEALAWTPDEQARLSEVAAEQIEAQRQLNNAGFFQFGKKKELKARIEELGRERNALEKAQLKAEQAQKEIDALQDKLEATKAEAKEVLEEHGLL